MEENIKNLRDAQQQTGANSNNESPVVEEHEVEVDVSTSEERETHEGLEPLKGREDALSSNIEDEIFDPIVQEEIADGVVKTDKQKNPKPLRKILKISKRLRLRTAKDAFGEDDPAAYTELLRDVRALATKEYTDAEIELLQGLRLELSLLKKRAKRSSAETKLTPFEITKLDTVVEKIINVQEILVESDLPFVLEDTSSLDSGEGDLTNLKDLEDDMIAPADQEQLLDGDIYLVEVIEEEADDYTRWTEPILQLIAVRDPKELD
jgi:hypothetical protein